MEGVELAFKPGQPDTTASALSSYIMLPLLLVTNLEQHSLSGTGTHPVRGLDDKAPFLGRIEVPFNLCLLLWVVGRLSQFAPEHISEPFFLLLSHLLHLECCVPPPPCLRFLARKCPWSPLVLYIFSLMDNDQI